MFFRFNIAVPPRVNVDEIVGLVRQAVRRILRQSVRIVGSEAPGEKLKYDLATQFEDTPRGAQGELMMPYQLKFTLPPGTQGHFIPGGLAVHSYGAAAAIQLAKGYPMGFWWEREGRYVYRWSVYHPGYRPTDDWGEAVAVRVEDVMAAEVAEIQDHIASGWGSRAV